jgi:hypothetical protein
MTIQIQKPEIKELLINQVRKDILVEALDHWIADEEMTYRDAKTEDESADAANRIAEATELYEELSGQKWKE